MKKFLLHLTLALFLISLTPALSQRQSRPGPHPATLSTSTIDEALALVEIYGKVRKIIGEDDRSELKGQLDQLNMALDKILYFKNSFTPKKMERIYKQIKQVKMDAERLVGQNVNEPRLSFLKLSDSLLDLVKTLMEPAPENRF